MCGKSASRVIQAATQKSNPIDYSAPRRDQVSEWTQRATAIRSVWCGRVPVSYDRAFVALWCSIIYDFAGSYSIGKEHFAFGVPTRYLQCDIQKDQIEKWDQAIEKGCAVYEKRVHNLL